MDPTPRNSASEAGRITAGPYDGEQFLEIGEARLADDFVCHDRRKIIGMPDMDKAAFLDLGAFDVEWGRTGSTREPLEVRGERLVLVRYSISYEDGSEQVHLALSQWDPAVTQMQRLMFFDLDDFDAAVAELDRWHADIGDFE